MDTPSESRSHCRPFKPIFVSRCHRQTATDRFSPDAPSIIRDNELMSPGTGALSEASSIISGNSSQTSLWQGLGRMHKPDIPVCQPHRNNLTALSQVHNLYFAAYQGQVYVYRPRTAVRNGLPRSPDLKLTTTPTYAATVVGGYVNPYKPHSINHIITGFLGHREIVVVSFDDGDVVAYYVEVLDGYIRGGSRQNLGTPVQPRAFFHDNVGISAWGLAVHSKSRLIAVSSNLKEVTVFAFAIHRRNGNTADGNSEEEDTAEARVHQRRCNWRIIVALGEACSNIPNICFMDDHRGRADKICAVDIDGSVWTTDIWKSKQPVTRILPTTGFPFISEEYFPTPPKGWGLVALPERSFMLVNTMSELVGFEFPENADQKWLRKKLNEHGGPTPLLDCAEGVDHASVDNPCPVSSSYFMSVQMRGYDRLRARHGGFDPLEYIQQMWAAPENPTEEEANALDMELDMEAPWLDMEQETMGPLLADDSSEDVNLVALEGADPVGLPPMSTLPFGVWQVADDEEAADEVGEASADPLSSVLAAYVAQGSDKSTAPLAGELGIEQGTSMIYRPHSGVITPAPVTNIERKTFIHTTQMWPSYNQIVGTGAGDRPEMGALGYRLLRSYEKEIDLQPCWKAYEGLESREIRVVASNVLTCDQLRFTDSDLSRLFRTTSRMNMVAEIPELYLVIFASPTGRVVIVTPTRLAEQRKLAPGYACKTGFRVECVLPRASDERVYRQEYRPLHGMAVGPVLQDRSKRGNRIASSGLPKRYRLMLHYRNHDILSYELSRDEETQRVGIF